MGYNLLLVEDSRVSRKIIKKTLNMTHITWNNIYEAENGEVALELLREHWIDIILSDLNMPVMNGVELIEEMSKDNILDNIPVVIVSTEGSKTRIEHLISKGAKAFIRKPFNPESMTNIINEILSGHEINPVRGLEITVCEILRDLTYTFAEPCELSLINSKMKKVFFTETVFKGKINGSIQVLIPRKLSVILSANMQGLEEDEEESKIDSPDAVKELSNVLCSHFLNAMYGNVEIFNISIPVVQEIKKGNLEEILGEGKKMCFSIDESFLIVNLNIEKRETMEEQSYKKENNTQEKNRRSVMIVDDSDFVAKRISKMIEECGYNVITHAKDGVEALEKYKELLPEIITLDVVMPKMSGLDTLNELKKLDKDVKVIVISALGHESLIKQFMEKGASKFLIKPFKRNQLLETLNSLS